MTDPTKYFCNCEDPKESALALGTCYTCGGQDVHRKDPAREELSPKDRGFKEIKPIPPEDVEIALKGYSSHYKTGNLQTRDKIQLVVDSAADFLTPNQIVDLSHFLKYFDRLGLKDKVEKDSYKCADYLHRLMNGEFLNKVNEATEYE